jgi:GxxExxY protein
MDKGAYPAIDPAVNRITKTIIGCGYTVSNSRGCGFLERVYEKALVCELVKQGLEVKQQQLVKIWYNGVAVGDYVADLIVEDSVLIEVKTVEHLGNTQTAQCLN